MGFAKGWEDAIREEIASVDFLLELISCRVTDIRECSSSLLLNAITIYALYGKPTV